MVSRQPYLNHIQFREDFVQPGKEKGTLSISEEYKGTDRYIIASNAKAQRDTIMNLASHAFSHYWKKYSSEKELEFNSLRKSYINQIDIKYPSRGKIITHGATGDLLTKHYIDVMDTIDDMKGQYLYNELEKSYSKILLQIKKPLT